MSSKTLFESMKEALTSSMQSMKGQGQSQEGGKRKCCGKKKVKNVKNVKKVKNVKNVKNVNITEFKKLLKNNKKYRLKRMKGGQFKLTDDATGFTYKCEKVMSEPVKDDTPSVTDLSKSLLDKMKEEVPDKPDDVQVGGKIKKIKKRVLKKKVINPTTRMSKTEYKKFLNRKDGEKLKKLARMYNIKVTKKVNGKTKNIKVENLRKKIFNCTKFL
jgi:hypothetical protein